MLEKNGPSPFPCIEPPLSGSFLVGRGCKKKTTDLYKNFQNLSTPIGILNIGIDYRELKQVKQDRQCTRNVTIRRVCVTIVAVEQQ